MAKQYQKKKDKRIYERRIKVMDKSELIRMLRSYQEFEARIRDYVDMPDWSFVGFVLAGPSDNEEWIITFWESEDQQEYTSIDIPIEDLCDE